MTHKAAIFDMDGLLLDTERLCLDCFLEAGRQTGYAVNPDVYLQCIGSNQERTKALLIAGHGEDFPYETIRNIWRGLYLENVLEKPIPVKAGAEKLLKAIVDSNTPVALATSTEYEHARIKLRNADLADYFDFIIGGDQVSEGKPHPEIYRKAAARLDVVPASCIAFEDSENGVRAALSAGINVIQVPDIVKPSTALRSLGHTIIDSLSDYMWRHQ